MRSPLRSAVLFVLLVFGVCFALDVLILRKGVLEDGLGGLMVWMPSILGVVLSVALGYGTQGLGLAKPRLGALFAGALVPMVAILMSGAALLVFQVDGWRSSPVLTITSSVIAFFLFLVGALGEELGWRGFLLSRLREANVKRRGIIVGLVWSVWHWPLILGGLYSSSAKPWISAFLFTVTVTSYGVFLAWLREKTDSVWPCVLSHAVHNFWVLHMLPGVLSPGPSHPFLAGESGVFLAASYLAVAFLARRR